MKKFAITAICAALILPALAGCAKKSVDYYDFVSEKRTEIYIYEDDTVNITVYCSEKEQPYSADGFPGEKCALAEIFVELAQNPTELCVQTCGYGGEMNYQSVNGNYYLSFTAEAFSSDGIDVELTADDKKTPYRALNVADGNIIDCKTALRCAAEYDKELFASLTDGENFKAEIYIRLLYDDGCYYYVGVCDRNSNLSSYLLDGEDGKVLTSKKTKLN